MKKRLNFIAFIGIFTIIILQGIWLYNTYNLVKKDIYSKVNTCFAEANEKEIFERLNVTLRGMPKETIISSDTSTENSDTFADNFVDIQESLIKFNSPLKLAKLKSQLVKSLHKNNIIEDILINRIQIKTKKILESTSPELSTGLLGSISSEIIPIRKNYSEGIQVQIISPYKTIFDRMLLILVSSIIMAIIVGCCIAYQIKIIIRQNKIAQLRQDITNALIHEMKTPLSSIIMGVKVLKSGKIDNQLEKKNKHFDICLEESNHLLQLTNRMLTIAKFEQEKLELNKQLVNLDGLIKSLIDKFKVSANKKVFFDSTINNDATNVVADYDYLQEAISNLIDNSIKYSSEEVEIKLHCIKEDNWLKIKVRDNGFGIAPENQATIFEKFERAAAVKRKNGATGFGLGLNYVIKVIEAHRGKVEIESIKDEYSIFTIYLPLLDQNT